jgi:hypothetical protein
MTSYQLHVETPLLHEPQMHAVCLEDFVAGVYVSCKSWVHEECLGLTRNDTEDFVCADCDLK